MIKIQQHEQIGDVEYQTKSQQAKSLGSFQKLKAEASLISMGTEEAPSAAIRMAGFEVRMHLCHSQASPSKVWCLDPLLLEFLPPRGGTREFVFQNFYKSCINVKLTLVQQLLAWGSALLCLSWERVGQRTGTKQVCGLRRLKLMHGR